MNKISNNFLLDEDYNEFTFPLPPARSDMCRDAFLKQLLQPFETSEESESSSDSRQYTKRLQFDDDEDVLNAEDVVFKEFCKRQGSRIGYSRMQSERMTQFSVRLSRIIAPDILKIMQGRQMSIYSALGFVGVIYQLTELNNKLRVLRELWKVDINLDKSFRMFSWAHQDYYKRFAMPNTTYLDITERELGDQMECYKFNIDIREISRLVDALESDYRYKHDICDNSMLLINEAKLDIIQVLMETRKEAEEAHANTVLEVCRMPRSADPDQSIRYAVNKEIDYADFIYPIEARYRIKWAETQADQYMNWNDREYDLLALVFTDFSYREKVHQSSARKMMEELTYLQTTTIESSFIWQSSSTAYEMQIAGLKKRIAKMEEEYDRRIGFVEDEKKIIENKLQQAIEDYNKCKDAIPFFHKRIAEVNAILNPPVEEEPEPEPQPVKTKKKDKGKKKYF